MAKKKIKVLPVYWAAFWGNGSSNHTQVYVPDLKLGIHADTYDQAYRDISSAIIKHASVENELPEPSNKLTTAKLFIQHAKDCSIKLQEFSIHYRQITI